MNRRRTRIVLQIAVAVATATFLFAFTFSNTYHLVNMFHMNGMELTAPMAPMDCASLCYFSATLEWDTILEAAFRFLLLAITAAVIVNVFFMLRPLALERFFSTLHPPGGNVQPTTRDTHFYYQLRDALRRGIIQPTLYA